MKPHRQCLAFFASLIPLLYAKSVDALLGFLSGKDTIGFANLIKIFL